MGKEVSLGHSFRTSVSGRRASCHFFLQLLPTPTYQAYQRSLQLFSEFSTEPLLQVMLSTSYNQTRTKPLCGGRYRATFKALLFTAILPFPQLLNDLRHPFPSAAPLCRCTALTL
jgi:hypothetical protein